MPDDVLEEVVRQYIASQDRDMVHFAWQGGEPLLAGLDFFRKVLELQKKYADGKVISNSIQTNGTLLDDAWGSFFAEHRFLVGLSVDGPRDLHDIYRLDRNNRPTFDRVSKGLATLRKYNVEFNTLTVVNDKNVRYPLKVYNFLKHTGTAFFQFIPLVERYPDRRSQDLGLDLAHPPDLDDTMADTPSVTPWSVDASQFGDFLVAIFDHWVRNDVGRIFVQIFDNALAAWYEGEASLCVFRKRCGDTLLVEHDGDVFSCDHFVYPDYRLGNIMLKSLKSMAFSPAQQKFGNNKYTQLPSVCRDCDVRFACNGGCPKHRFLPTPDGQGRLNYLCEGYKTFFHYVEPYMEKMCELLDNGIAPAMIMEILRQKRAASKKHKLRRH